MFAEKSIRDKPKKKIKITVLRIKIQKVRFKKKINRADSLIMIISDTGFHSVIFKTVTDG